MIGIVYLFLIIICPFIYQYLLKNLNQKTRTETFDDHTHSRLLSLHENMFFIIQGCISLLSIKYLLMYCYVIEFFVSFINVLIFSRYFSISDLNWNLDKSKTTKMILLLLLPLIVMNFVRNHFDTYLIGYFIFNIGNIALLLWELSMISIIYFYQLWNHPGSKLMFLLISLKMFLS